MDIDPAWLERDLYGALGVEPTASAPDITKAYRRLARQLHPDINPDPDAAARFESVSTAYQVLRDRDSRRAYDRARDQLDASRARRRPGGGYRIRVEHLDTPPDADIPGAFDVRAHDPRGSVIEDLIGMGRRRSDRRSDDEPRSGRR